MLEKFSFKRSDIFLFSDLTAVGMEKLSEFFDEKFSELFHFSGKFSFDDDCQQPTKRRKREVCSPEKKKELKKRLFQV